jgi:hypothetical protein
LNVRTRLYRSRLAAKGIGGPLVRALPISCRGLHTFRDNPKRSAGPGVARYGASAMHDKAIIRFHEKYGIHARPLSKEEVLDWLDAGLTCEEIRAKLKAQIVETAELEGRYGQDEP